jgi:hypothetical protein
VPERCVLHFAFDDASRDPSQVVGVVGKLLSIRRALESTDLGLGVGTFPGDPGNLGVEHLQGISSHSDGDLQCPFVLLVQIAQESAQALLHVDLLDVGAGSPLLIGFCFPQEVFRLGDCPLQEL